MPQIQDTGHKAAACCFLCLAVSFAGSALAIGAQPSVLARQSSAPAAPAPDPVALLRAVGDHQKQNEAARKDYIFDRRDDDQQLDSHGKVKSTEVKEYEVYFVGPGRLSGC